MFWRAGAMKEGQSKIWCLHLKGGLEELANLMGWTREMGQRLHVKVTEQTFTQLIKEKTGWRPHSYLSETQESYEDASDQFSPTLMVAKIRRNEFKLKVIVLSMLRKNFKNC